MDLPFVTVAIPCFDEERHIAACIRDVLEQDYPAERMEVLVGDGMSRDRTREILRELVRAHPGRLRVIDNPKRLQAAAMNVMIREARGDVIVRMDVHARYAPDFVRQCVTVLRETGAQNVGGAARPLSESDFQEAVCAALRSRLAVGGSAYRHSDSEGFTDTVFPGAFPKKVLEDVGGFDDAAITNEDAELNQRILRAGGRIYVSRKIVVHYFPRDSFAGLARQYFKYGKGRARTLLKHRGLPTVRPMLPFFLVVSGASMLASRRLRRFAPLALGAYAAVSLAEAVRVCFGTKLRMIPIVAAIFPVIHMAHGIGFAAGLVHYVRRPDW
jgi:succinoglycan biosynthesis protein ExoA